MAHIADGTLSEVQEVRPCAMPGALHPSDVAMCLGTRNDGFLLSLPHPTTSNNIGKDAWPL